MAQSALGSFAAPFQPTQEAINPLQALIQGFQLPQQIQDQALQKQLNDLILRQKIADIQNPDAALARQIREQLSIQGALNPTLGIQQAPTGLEGITIQNPSAIGQTSNDLNAAIAANPSFGIPRAAAGLTENPIAINGVQTGLNRNLNTIAQAAQDAAKLKQKALQDASDIIQNRQIAVDRDKEQNKAKIPAKITAKQEGNFIVKRDSQTGEKIGEPEPIPQDSKFVTIAGMGSGFVDETTKKFTPIEGTVPTTSNTKLGHMQGYDTKTGTFGIFTPDENGNFPEGIIPSSQAPKPDSTSPVNKEFQADALDRSIEAIDSLIKRTNSSTTGRASRLQGSKLYPDVLQSDAYVDYKSDLDSLKAGVFLTQIAAMKQSSKTGSAGLGAISNKEGGRLESAYASLIQDQSPPNIKKNLEIAKDAIQKYRDALTKYGNTKNAPATGGSSTANPQGKIQIIAPDGQAGFWPSDQPVPEGYKIAQ